MPYANPEKEKAYKKNYRATHREQFQGYAKKFDEKHKERRKGHWATFALRRKYDVLCHYSGTVPPQCKDPYGIHEKPFTLIDALTIEHPNQDGGKERKKLFGKRYRAGQQFYRWLVKNGYPEGYEVLCFNCQWLRRGEKIREQVRQENNSFNLSNTMTLDTYSAYCTGLGCKWSAEHINNYIAMREAVDLHALQTHHFVTFWRDFVYDRRLDKLANKTPEIQRLTG